MITRITGRLTALAQDELTLAIGAFDYEVRIPEFTRRQLQSRVGEDVSLHTIEYFEGNPMQGRMTPRLVGFLSEAEREFFELFCSVDGVGVKKALRAMVRPVREVATAIEEQDATALAGLPGPGPTLQTLQTLPGPSRRHSFSAFSTNACASSRAKGRRVPEVSPRPQPSVRPS